MKCLNCSTEMTNNQVLTIGARIAYDMCDACGSLWLDSGELDKIAFRVTGSIEYCEAGKDAEPEQTIKRCPRCVDFDLQKVRFLESDDIFLHYCRNCGGFWLDGGEQPCVVARQPFGRVAIANADAAAYSYTDAAIDEAYRAVDDLLGISRG